MHHEDGTIASVEEVLRAAAEHGLAQASVSVAAHDKQVGADIGRQVFEPFGHRLRRGAKPVRVGVDVVPFQALCKMVQTFR